jgi:hypothetical protein
MQIIIGIGQANFSTELTTYRYLHGILFEVSSYKDGDDVEI